MSRRKNDIMKDLSWKDILVFTSEFCIVVALIGVGVNDIMNNVEENGCSMTWMYEYPQYLKVSLSTEVQNKFPKYALYIYGEGVYAEYLYSMNERYQLDGVPVVFVHGNAGRYKQVRSPGSVSLRKSESRPYHFNYFSVDYDEELSALYGPFLKQQTEFLYHSINRILQCYDHLNDKPQSVIAIGHSMGGLVIRGLFILPYFNSEFINTIVTLATPQTEPPVTLDSEIELFYRDVNQYWRQRQHQELRNVTFLSLGGGFRDYLVRSDLCVLSSTNPFHMSSLTTSLPFIWLSTDHQCIVWCNELVRSLTRIFFQLIDKKTKQITNNHYKRARIFENVLFNKDYKMKVISLPSNCQHVNISTVIKLYIGEPGDCIYFDLSALSSNDVVHIWAVTRKSDWIYSCETRNSCYRIDSDALPGNSHFVSLYIKNASAIFMLQLNNRGDKLYIQRQEMKVLNLLAPSLLTVLEEYSFQESFYKCFDVYGITEPWQVLEISIYKTGKDSTFIVQTFIPWSNELNYFNFNSNHASFKLQFFHEKPFNESRNVQICLWNPFLSKVKLSITPAWIERFAQFLRFNIGNLLRYILVFSVMRALLLSTVQKSRYCMYISMKMKALYLICFTVLSKSIYACFSRSSGYMLHRVILPQIVLTLLSILLSDVIYIILMAILFILKPIRFVVASTYKVVLKFELFLSVMFIVFAYMAHLYNDGVLVVFMMIVHIMKLDTVTTWRIKLFHYNIFTTIAPSILLFAVLPVLVCMQDVLKGFSHQKFTFMNLEYLSVCYFLYLVSNFSRYNGLPFGDFEFHQICVLQFLIFTYLSLFQEFLELYKFVYIVASYIALIVVCHFAANPNYR